MAPPAPSAPSAPVPSASGDALLRFADVACARAGRVLFAGIGFTLSPGAALRITGANGVGKTSLIRLAAGLLLPVAGTVARTGAAALCDEQAALDPERTVAEALGFWARLDGADADAPRAALAALGAPGLMPVPVRLLSTGQRKRVALARTLASGAPLWLLDEPANGLDAVGQAGLEAAIAAHRARGGAVLAASHIPLALPGAATLALAGDAQVMAKVAAA